MKKKSNLVHDGKEIIQLAMQVPHAGDLATQHITTAKAPLIIKSFLYTHPPCTWWRPGHCLNTHTKNPVKKLERKKFQKQPPCTWWWGHCIKKLVSKSFLYTHLVHDGQEVVQLAMQVTQHITTAKAPLIIKSLKNLHLVLPIITLYMIVRRSSSFPCRSPTQVTWPLSEVETREMLGLFFRPAIASRRIRQT